MTDRKQLTRRLIDSGDEVVVTYELISPRAADPERAF
jgi:hypothetical protein